MGMKTFILGGVNHAKIMCLNLLLMSIGTLETFSNSITRVLMLLKWIWFGMLLWQFKPEPIPKKVFQLVVTWKLGACCSILLAMAWTIFSLIRWHFLPHLLDSLAASSISNGRPGPLNALHAIHAKATLWGFFVEIFQGKHFQMPDWQHSKYAYITIHIYIIYTHDSIILQKICVI